MVERKTIDKNSNRMDNLNRLLIHPKFKKTIDEINKLNIKLPRYPTDEELDFRSYTFPPNGELISNIEEIGNYPLDPKKGEKIINENRIISAYDESVKKFSALEGTAYITSHSLIVHYNGEYLPSNFLTFYFYTRSLTFTSGSKLIKYSSDPESDSKRDYVKDRSKFILDHAPKNSIIFIDGPLIGGQISEHTINLNNALLEKNNIPIFFVKNSSSNLVTDNTKELKNKFNSDMHWAYHILKKGERTNFFQYVDKHKPKNAKLFCYLKSFDVSPQRIEFHLKTFEKHPNIITDMMDLVYYLLLVQSDLKNPQIRSIDIAEKYARDTLDLMDLAKIMKSTGIIPTINQERFAWG